MSPAKKTKRKSIKASLPSVSLLRQSIFRTLAYADIFTYPLTASEVWRFLIGRKKISFPAVRSQLEQMAARKQLGRRGGFYFLPGREGIIKIRKRRAGWSQEKLKIARRVSSWLKLIPWIKMVAVTGALAMKNATRNDDIDFLVVTRRQRLWLTRLLTVLLVEIVADRRRPANKNYQDKICLNMFLDEDHLALPPSERDLFSAHEVSQMKILWDKEEVYQKLIQKNQWLKDFLPNWKP